MAQWVHKAAIRNLYTLQMKANIQITTICKEFGIRKHLSTLKLCRFIGFLYFNSEFSIDNQFLLSNRSYCK